MAKAAAEAKRGNLDPMNPAQDEDPYEHVVDLGLTEDGLPERSTL
jgi:hypothetical protein